MIEPLAQRLSRLSERIGAHAPVPQAEGVLVRMVGMALEAQGLNCPVGSRCLVAAVGGRQIEAEVVGFAEQRTFLMPIVKVAGLQPGARVTPVRHSSHIAVGEQLLGRVIDGAGRPLDGKGPLKCHDSIDLDPDVINPLARRPISETLDVGIRAINAMTTVGQGQRLGLFAGSGVGKSVLLGMMTRFTSADIVIVGLVGERGREVREFIDHVLGEAGLRRAVVVAAPADEAPLMRLRSAVLATRLAEYYRDRGQNVLLLMDSLTRYAQAQREIALAIGEPPATKGYPPSVFAKMPQLVERAGNAAEGSGSITAFYTVLTEGDDLQDPVADAARAILDGHVVLSRRLADEGHYPAIDIEASISRAMPNIVTPQHIREAQRVKQLYSRYQQNRDLIAVGAYTPGSDPETDEAIRRLPAIREFLQQSMNEGVDFATSSAQLQALAARPPQAQEPGAPPANTAATGAGQ